MEGPEEKGTPERGFPEGDEQVASENTDNAITELENKIKDLTDRLGKLPESPVTPVLETSEEKDTLEKDKVKAAGQDSVDTNAQILQMLQDQAAELKAIRDERAAEKAEKAAAKKAAEEAAEAQRLADEKKAADEAAQAAQEAREAEIADLKAKIEAITAAQTAEAERLAEGAGKGITGEGIGGERVSTDANLTQATPEAPVGEPEGGEREDNREAVNFDPMTFLARAGQYGKLLDNNRHDGDETKEFNAAIMAISDDSLPDSPEIKTVRRLVSAYGVDL